MKFRPIPFLTNSVILLAILAMAVSSAWRSIPLQSGNAMVSALAVGDSVVAVGLSQGGMRFVSRKDQSVSALKSTQFGPRGRILDLAWMSDRVIAASEGGLAEIDPVSKSISPLANLTLSTLTGGTRALKARGNELWMVGPKAVAMVDGIHRGKARSWKLPLETDIPQCLLVVGSSVIVGTNASGLLLLDVETGVWTRLRKAEGLPEDQITGLEMIGTRIFVATTGGLAVMELTSHSASEAVAGLVSGWMTQINGSLVVSTFDGLTQIDAGTFATSLMEVDSGSPEGSVVFDRGLLVSGGMEGRLLWKETRTILGSNPLQNLPEGFLLHLAAPLASGDSLQATLRLPEWIAAAVPVEISRSTVPLDRILRLPSGTSGHFLLELDLIVSEKVAERRTIEVVADRAPPTLILDPVPSWTRDSFLIVKGKAQASTGVELTRWGDPRPIDLDDSGRFTTRASLANGSNTIHLRATDRAGNFTERETGVIRDGLAPWLQATPPDTVDDAQIQLRLKMREPNLAKSSIEPASQASVLVLDSTLMVDLHDLADGPNKFQIRLLDLAGNQTVRDLSIVRRPKVAPPPPALVIAPSTSVQANSSKAPLPSTALPSTSPSNPSPSSPTAAPIDSAQPHIPAAKSVASTNLTDSVLLNDMPSPGTSRQNPSRPRNAADVIVVRYHLQDGETIRRVAERFYGNRDLSPILTHWNNLDDSSSWRHMPIGTVVDVPFWRDFEHGKLTRREALSSPPKKHKKRVQQAKPVKHKKHKKHKKSKSP